MKMPIVAIVEGHNFTVHCLSIAEGTVQVRVDGPKGGTAELQLSN